MSDTPVLYQVDGAVATITLNRPDVLNALNTALMLALREAVEKASADAAVRAVVVTGAGRGIGLAIAAKLAEEGARVVVNDLDADAAREAAALIGATAIPGDAASEAGVEALIGAARAHLGQIDIFFANAGTAIGVGLDSTEEAWATALEVNVMAHVRAARLLVPEWLERGGGRFVVTASAAGLLLVTVEREAA